MTVLLKAINVSQPQADFNGVKAMLYIQGKGGDQNWLNTGDVYLMLYFFFFFFSLLFLFFFHD